MPSVNDCSRTASPPNPIKGGWNASESVAGFRRNHRLEWIGIAGWFASEYAMYADVDGNGLVETVVTWSGKTRAELPVPTEMQVNGIGVLYFS